MSSLYSLCPDAGPACAKGDDESDLWSGSAEASALRPPLVSVESDQADASRPSTSMPSVAAAAVAEPVEPTAAAALAAGGDTVKLTPHFLHLIRLPIRLDGILPRSPQLGHVTKAIVQTSKGGMRKWHREMTYTPHANALQGQCKGGSAQNFEDWSIGQP